MLCFDIRDLREHAVRVDGVLGQTDPVWQEGDPRPARPLRATGRLSPAGPGRFYWTGLIEAEVELCCRRCLTEVESAVSEDVHLIFAEMGDESADDPDVYLLAPRAPELDLRPAIREQWLLAVPSFALCQEACRGLCARCGADLNSGDCQCAPEADRRWEVPRTVRNSSQ